jgi:hypothetical protein
MIAGLPLRHAAVEHAHPVGAERAEGPPDARRAVEPDAVIEHDGGVVADAERADLRGELLRRRQHVGQGIGLVRDRVDVEALRTRNVAGEKLGLGVALGIGEIIGGVEHDHARVGQMLAQPIGRDQPAAGELFIRHCFFHSH